MFSLVNPIPAAMQDQGKQKDFFDKHKKYVVPYYGNEEQTSHATLQLLRDLCELSPSHAACMTYLKTFCFGGMMGQLDVRRSSVPGFIPEEESQALTYQEKKSFVDFLSSYGISFIQLVKLTNTLFQSFKENGNAYLKIKVVRVEGTTKVYLSRIHYKHIAYLDTKKMEDKEFLITKVWEEEWMKKNKDKVQTIYASQIGEPFVWKESDQGRIKETVVHLKNEIDESDFYGRPDIMSVLDWMFSEHMLGNHSCKVNASETVTKNILFTPEEHYENDEGGEDDADKQFKKKVRVIKKLMTNEGEIGSASSMAVMEFANDMEKPFMVSVDINRETGWFKEQIEKASAFIHSVHKVPRELTRMLQTKGGLGDNSLINLFITNAADVIIPTQQEWETFWSFVFGELAELLGEQSMKDYTIKFPDRVQPVVDKIREMKVKGSKQRTNENEENDTEGA